MTRRAPTLTISRDEFVAELAAARAASGKSFAVLARELGHPRSTLHGWCRGDHLPFPRDDAVFERLLVAIGVDDTAPWIATLQALRQRATIANPYLGLEPFTEDDADRFHGRGALVTRLLAAADATSADVHHLPLVVVGASGSGKTSVLRAGLAARLRERPGHRTLVVTPGDDPVDRLERATAQLSGARHATLVVDQFEELFTLAPDDVVAETVQVIARAQRAHIQVVIGVRADFFHHLAGVPYLLQALDRRQVVVGPMTTGELTEAIVVPAEQAGLRIAPDLLAHLLREFDGHANGRRPTHALPLLSHVLFSLAESADGTVLRLADYLAAGGLGDALRRTADEALDEVPGRLRAACRRVFLQLVELRSDTTPTRRRATWAALQRVAPDAEIRTVLDPFVRRRLLTLDHDTVSLTHEALIDAWPTLHDWVDDQREELLVRRRLRTAHRNWVETGRPADALLRGTLLEEARRVAEGPLRSSLDDGQLEFLEASELAHHEALARDAALLSRQIAAQSDLCANRDPSLSGHLALEAIGVADTVEARSAVLRNGASAAGPRFVGPTGPTAIAAAPAVGRAVAAFHATGRIDHVALRDGLPIRTATGPVALPRVHTVAFDDRGTRLVAGTRTGSVVLVEQHGVVELPPAGFDGPVLSVAVSPEGDQVVAAGGPPGIFRWRRDGDGWGVERIVPRDVTTMCIRVHWPDGLIATASADGYVGLWSLDGTPVWSASPSDARPVASSVAFSPDGCALAAGYHDGSLRVWCLRNDDGPREHPLGSAAFATWVNDLAFSPDGDLLAAASSDGTVRLWDTTSWRELRVELRHPSVVSGVRFLADRTIMTCSEDGIVRTWDVAGAVTGSDASIWATKFDADGSMLVAASRTMLTIDRGEGLRRHRQTVPAPAEEQLLTGTCDVSADGRVIAAGTRNGAIQLIDGATGTPIRVVRGDLGPIVEGVTWLGSTLVAVDSGGRLHRWVLDESFEVVESVGSVVSTGTALSVCDVGDGCVAVATEPGELVVVDVSAPDVVTERARFRPGEAFPICAAKHPVAEVVAVGGADRAVSIWSVADWSHPRLVTRLVGPAGHVMAVAIDRAGTRVAAGTTDGRIWIWSWHDDQLEHWATIETGEAGVYAVQFSPDGRHLVSAGPNHRIRWWPLELDEATQLVRLRVGDPLSSDERARLMPTAADRV